MLIHIFLGLVCGLVLGFAQGRILHGIIHQVGVKRYLLLILKLILWGLCMTLLALWSLAALIAFVFSATAAMLVMASRMLRKKEV